MRITGGGEHIKGALFAHFHNGHIQRTTAQVKHQDLLFFTGFVNTKSQGCSRRLVDEAHYIQARNAAGVFGGLTLVVVKVGRHSDNGFFHRFTQESFGIFFNFLQNKGRELLRRKFLSAQVIFKVFPHFAFKRSDGAVRVGNRLAAGRLTHEALAIFRKGYIRRERFSADRAAFGRRNNRASAAFHNRRCGVRSTQVNTNNLSHMFISP